jgi:hypothetical protein
MCCLSEILCVYAGVIKTLCCHKKNAIFINFLWSIWHSIFVHNFGSYADCTTSTAKKIVQLTLLPNRYSVIVFHIETLPRFDASRKLQCHPMKWKRHPTSAVGRDIWSGRTKTVSRNWMKMWVCIEGRIYYVSMILHATHFLTAHLLCSWQQYNNNLLTILVNNKNKIKLSLKYDDDEDDDALKGIMVFM